MKHEWHITNEGFGEVITNGGTQAIDGDGFGYGITNGGDGYGFGGFDGWIGDGGESI